MSHIRGRIKTVVDYGGRLPGVTGTCCDSTGNKTVKTFNQCMSENGNWSLGSPDLVTCPDSTALGCCCACPYTTKNTGTEADFMHPGHAGFAGVGSREASSDGVRTNITQCECDYVGGNWTPDCPEDENGNILLCRTDGIESRFDVRVPFACCHCDEDENGVEVRACSNVCSSAECLLLEENSSGSQNCQSEYDIFSICDYSTFDGRDPKLCSELPPEVPIPDGEGEFLTQTGSDDASACCHLSYDGNKYTCSYRSREECEQMNGLYNVPDENGPILCTDSICPDPPKILDNGFVESPTIKEENLPEIGSVYGGGIYLGVFTPGISEVLANTETGPTPYRNVSSREGSGDKTKWALIVSPTDLGSEFGIANMTLPYIGTSEVPMDEDSSVFDGFFNTYGNNKDKKLPQTHLYKQIRNYNRFGFKDWYLPSVHELGFIAGVQREISFGVNLNRYSQNHTKLQSNLPYLSSTRKTRNYRNNKQRKFENYPAANLVYGILIGNVFGPMNGYTFLSGLDSRFRVRLVRKIKLES